MPFRKQLTKTKGEESDSLMGLEDDLSELESIAKSTIDDDTEIKSRAFAFHPPYWYQRYLASKAGELPVAVEGMEDFAVQDSIETNPDHVPIVWSVSRADCAEQCAYKYKRTKIDKVSDSTVALQFGSQAHDIIAKALEDKSITIGKFKDIIKRTKNLDEQLYDIAQYMYSFTRRAENMATREGIDFIIEKKYGATREFEEASYFARSGLFLRLVVDMWAMDEKNRRLIVIDHKTNKKKSSEAEVRVNKQLNLYVAVLTEMFKLDWDEAYVALNLLRHEQIVWAKITRAEATEFLKEYTKYLDFLDTKISRCEATGVWEQEKGFWCSWCGLRDECGFEVSAGDAQARGNNSDKNSTNGADGAPDVMEQLTERQTLNI